MILPVTLTTAAALAVLNLWLAARVGRLRLARKVLVGDGGDPAVLATMRAHANFTEYAPFVLILIAAIELAGGTQFWLQVAAIAFVLARIAHGLGMARGTENLARAGGIAATFLVLLGLAGWAAVLAWHGGAGAAAVKTFEAAPVRG